MTKRRNNDYATRQFQLGWLGLACFVLALCGAGPARGESGAAINEAGYVRIGGIDQWIQIRGDDRSNPVLLWLNGGPGYSTIPSTPAYRAWERVFTVVMWDQRGEGKTFERSGKSVASTMTIGKMTADGIEVAEHLRHRLRQNKIILLGHSWGSILGTHMVKRRPDLFSVYVGTGQVVQLAKDAEAAYPLLVERARAVGNSQAEKQLLEVGPPPYEDSPRKWVWVRWANQLDPRPARAAETPSPPRGPPPASIEAGAEFSQGLMWESMLRDDLRALGPRFALPVVFIQGAEDRLTVTALAKDYFDTIRAPKKDFVVLAEVGHLAIFTDPAAFLNALTEHVRPLAAGQ